MLLVPAILNSGVLPQSFGGKSLVDPSNACSEVHAGVELSTHIYAEVRALKLARATTNTTSSLTLFCFVFASPALPRGEMNKIASPFLVLPLARDVAVTRAVLKSLDTLT